jgi:hypothetical protein
MQYTASSFAEPVLEPFTALVRTRVSAVRPQGYFPSTAHYEEVTEDVAAMAVLSVTRRAAAALSWVTVLQIGRIQVYLLYILITVIAVFAWWIPR